MADTIEITWYLNPIFYIALAGVVIALFSLVLGYRTRRQIESRNSRDDYKIEIEPLLNFFNNLMSTQSPYSNALWGIFHQNRITGKRVLQHLYTFEQTHELYEIIKKYYQNKTENPNQAQLFRGKFKDVWKNLKNSSNPDFGACSECVNHIALKHVKKHKEFLENADEKMWDFIDKK